MHQNNIFWLEVAKQLHDTFRVGVRGETHVIYLHLYVDDFVIDRYFFFARKDLVAHSAGHAIARNDHRILLVACPLLEGL